MLKNKKPLLLIILLGTAIFIFSKCMNNASAADPRGQLYAGSASCRQCHQAVYDSFISTAHFNSTASVNEKNIHGSFSNTDNTFSFADGSQVKMEKRDSGYFQVLYKNGKEVEAHRMDLLFGGRHAQTFLSWKGDQGFELPVSHYNAVQAWGTSPGYDGFQPFFGRLVVQGCFECHSSNVQTTAEMKGGFVTERYVRGTLVNGIDCERCHGPGANHVNYHEAYPEEKRAKYMITNHSLSRQQQLDACAICHGGNDAALIASRFEFKNGDTLAKFMVPFGGRDNKKGPDVHGNQASLLAQSKCFQGSTMTCQTCHDPHKNADESLATFSQQCMSCHKEQSNNFCPKAATIGASIKNNCIDCHMPSQNSMAIKFQLAGDKPYLSYVLRTHRIAIYDSSARAHDKR